MYFVHTFIIFIATCSTLYVSTYFCLTSCDQLLSNYDTDSDAKMFLDKGDWYFLFVHNPDGYVYTWTDVIFLQ